MLRSQKGEHSANVQPVEFRRLADVGDVVAAFWLESTYGADEIQSDINPLRYSIKCSHFIQREHSFP